MSGIYGGIHVPGIVVGIISLIMLQAAGADAVTQIDSCTEISLPGEYMLNSSITDNTEATCIDITSSDVILDVAGFTVSGIESPYTYGVLVFNSTAPPENVIIKNLTVKN